jgi:hypothetical protein
MAHILLSTVIHLPELIYGKVCIFEEGKYTLLNPSQYTSIRDGFDPLDYAILVHPKYNRCIVYSNKSDKIHFLVNKKYKELLETKKKLDPFRLNDKIHIHSRQGIYEIIGIGNEFIEISCNKWKYTNTISIKVPKNDFKCLAGGLHNYAE